MTTDVLDLPLPGGDRAVPGAAQRGGDRGQLGAGGGLHPAAGVLTLHPHHPAQTPQHPGGDDNITTR